MNRDAADIRGARDAILPRLTREPGRALADARALLASLGDDCPLVEHALTLRLVAHALRASGRVEEAETHYARAYSMLRPIDEEEAARTVIGWVQTLAVLGRLSRARELASRVRPALSRVDPVAGARLDTNLANALLHAGEVRAAQQSYRRSFDVFRAQDRAQESTHAAFGLARSFLAQGDGRRARTWLERSEAAFEGEVPPVLHAYLRSSAAIADLLEGRRVEGVEALVSLQHDLENLDDRRSAVELLLHVTKLLVALGAEGAAQRVAQKCLKVSLEIGSPFDAARGALFAAQAGEHRGSPLDVGHHLALAEDLGPKDSRLWRARVRLMRSALRLREGHAAEVRQELGSLQARFDALDAHGSAVRCRVLRARAWMAEGKSSVAQRLLVRARRDARGSSLEESRPRMALLLAECAQAKGDARAAVRWAERAVNELESALMHWHRTSLRRDGAEARDAVHGRAAEIVLANAKRRRVERAVDLVVRARSPRLIEDLLEHLPQFEQSRARQLHDRLLRERNDSDIDPTTRSTGGGRAVAHSVAPLRVDHFARSSRSPAVVRRAWSLRDMQSWRGRLGARTMILFHESSPHWRAFVIPAVGSIRTVELVELQEGLRKVWRPLRLIFETAARLPQPRREEFLDRTRDEANVSIEALTRAIVDPLDLDGGRVVLVPDGSLHDLPLEALLTQRGIEECTRLPHPALLRQSRRLGARRAMILHGGSEGQMAEARALGRRMRRHGYQVRTANRGRLLVQESERVGALHLAAHGVFHRDDERLSTIHLADGPVGFEVLRTKALRGSLVFFASCESGLAARRAGRDLEGWITSGFAHGVREMVLTLWKIDDTTSQGFARDFYEGWLEGRSAGQAVMAASAAARARGEHPYRWAAHFAAG